MAVGVAQELHLNVTGVLQQPLQVNRVVAKGRLGLPPGEGNSGLQFCPRMCHADAHPATAGHRLEHHRVADTLGGVQQFIVVQGARRALNDRDG